MGGRSGGFELRFELTEEQMRQMRAKRLLRDLSVERPATRSLRSTYYDTPDHSLHAKGLSLHLRRNATRWVQTVQGPAKGGAERRAAAQTDTSVSGPRPSLKEIVGKGLRKRVKKTVGKAALEPVFETAVRRTTRRLRTPDGSEVELTFDKGEVRAGSGATGISVAELELKSGEVASVYALAEALLDGGPVRFCGLSPAERGYRLAAGMAAFAPSPRFASKPRLTREQTADAAFRVLLKSCNDQILGNFPAVLETEDPEGPHQLRVGTRRLRSTLRACRWIADDAAARRLAVQARSLGRLVGPLRDADVLIDEIVAPHLARDPRDVGFQALMEVLSARRARVRKAVRTALLGDDVGAFQLALGAFAEADAWRRSDDKAQAVRLKAPATALAGSALDHAWKRAAKWGKRIDRLSIAERHEMRKALKHLRYTVEFFAPLYVQKRAGPYLQTLKRLQDVFGYLNDVAMADKLREVCTGKRTADPAVQRALGLVQGWNLVQAEHAWHDAKARWRQLKDLKSFWK